MIQNLLGFDSDYIIIGLLGITLLLLILLIVNSVQLSKMKRSYQVFMTGKDAKSLEDTLVERLEQVNMLMESNDRNHQNIDAMFLKQKTCFCKHGMLKYDAFEELGGKLSFVLAILNENNNGYILNVMHNREGCYTYIKDIIDGNSVVSLSSEEQEALDRALASEG